MSTSSPGSSTAPNTAAIAPTLAGLADVFGGGEVGLADVEADRARRAQRLVGKLANAGVRGFSGQMSERRQRNPSHVTPIVGGQATDPPPVASPGDVCRRMA